MNEIRKILAMLTRSDRVMLIALALLMVVSGLLEILGVGLLFPYISILQNQKLIMTNHYLSTVYRGIGFETTKSFSIALSIGFLVIFCLKGLFSIWMNSFQIKFIFSLQARLGEELMADYLAQPYAFFLTSNTSNLISNLTNNINRFCAGTIQSVLTIGSEGFVLIGLLGFLIYINPGFSLIALAFVGAISVTFERLAKRRVNSYGNQSEQQWTAMTRTANEAMSSAKEVQTLGRQKYFLNTYSASARIYAWAVSRFSLFSQLSRVILETGAVGGMVLLCLYALITNTMGPNLFSVLAVFAFATIRIVPSANRILLSWNTFVYNLSAVNIISEVREQGAPIRANAEGTGVEMGSFEIALRKELEVSIKFFAYPANLHFNLSDIVLTIRQGERVAFIGQSGSGKTTLVDLILGLFPDYQGQILVDGVNVRGKVPYWRKHVGYIPQTVYLRDDTIARNIAFGIDDKDIDMQSIMRSVTLAELSDVILRQPDGIMTVVGDRGVRLSGGERQRIGIARALYHDPDLLVLDEATSALDNETERQIVDSILSLSPSKTIIVIAHRLSTVQRCDCLYLMSRGRIIDQGPFADIERRNPHFMNPTGTKLAGSYVTL